MRAPSHYHSHTRHELTERQRDVLDLVARGKTNPQIADALGMTLDGAKFHVSEILAKLDVSSREEAGEWWRRENSAKQRIGRSLAVLWAAPLGRIVVSGGGLVLAAAIAGGVFLANSASHQTPSSSAHAAFVFQVNDAAGGPTQIIVYDADAHRVAGKFVAPRAETLGRGDSIYTGLQSRTLRTVGVDGTLSAPLYTAPTGEQILDIAPSPDGHMLALEQTSNMAGAGDDAVVLLNLDDNHVLQTFRVAKLVPDTPTATIADGLRWNSDSLAVTIQLPASGTSNVPDPQASQAVLLGVDGSIHKTPLEAMAMLSPDGSMAAEGKPMTPDCVGFGATHTLKIVDLRSGATLSSVTNPNAGLRPFAWMPDGSGFVYVSSSSYAGCNPGGSDQTYWLLPAHRDARQLPGDPESQMSDTLAGRISWSCGGNAPQHFGEGVMANPGALLGELATCTPLGGPLRPPGGPTPTPRSQQLVRLFVDGKPAFDAYEAMLIGHITLSP